MMTCEPCVHCDAEREAGGALQSEIRNTREWFAASFKCATSKLDFLLYSKRGRTHAVRFQRAHTALRTVGS